MNWKRSSRIGIVVLMAVAAIAAYRDSMPPLPPYLKVPPGSAVEVSHYMSPGSMAIFFSNHHYMRIHSPLEASPTVRYLQKSFGTERTSQHEKISQSKRDMGGYAQKREGYAISISMSYPYEFIAAIANYTGTYDEISPTLRVWPEPKGSTIEFYYETRMN